MIAVRKRDTEKEWTDLLRCKAICGAKAFDVVRVVAQCMNLVGREVEQFEVRVFTGFETCAWRIGLLGGGSGLLYLRGLTAITSGGLSW